MRRLRKFRERFSRAIGHIEGNEAELIQIITVSASWHCHVNGIEAFGCQPNERAFLAQWVPAGTRLDFQDGTGRFLGRTHVKPETIVPWDLWVTFPKMFGVIPVYYRRFLMNGESE